MKLSKKTENILKNFSSIHPNIYVEEGSTLKSINAGRNFIAKAEVEETFPQAFGFYNLDAFLQVYSLLEEPELDFNEKYVSITSKNSTIKYYFTNKENLNTFPGTTLDMGETMVQVHISYDEIQAIKKAAAAFQDKVNGANGASLTISSNGDGKVYASTNGTSGIDSGGTHSYEFILEEDCPYKEEFSLSFSLFNLNISPDEYTITFNDRGMSMWEGEKEGMVYYAGVEVNTSKTSR